MQTRRIVLVTGASSGIGEALALVFLERAMPCCPAWCGAPAARAPGI